VAICVLGNDEAGNKKRRGHREIIKQLNDSYLPSQSITHKSLGPKIGPRPHDKALGWAGRAEGDGVWRKDSGS
jgi:hypothetical protein